MSDDFFIPHKYSAQQKQNPNYGVQLIEEVAINAFSQYTQDLNQLFNIDIKYQYKEKENDNSKVHILSPIEMGAGYGFLPTLLTLYTQKTFKQIFPTDEYPVGLFADPMKASFWHFIPTLKNAKHFSSLLNMVDYSVEDYINKSLVKTLLPLHNNAPFFTIKDNKMLQEILFEVIKKNNFKEVSIGLNDDVEKLLTLIHNHLRPSEQHELPKPKFLPIESDFQSLYESIHQQYEDEFGKLDDRISIRISDEKEYNSMQKASMPIKQRYEQYIYNEEKDARARLNSGESDSKNGRLVYYGI